MCAWAVPMVQCKRLPRHPWHQLLLCMLHHSLRHWSSTSCRRVPRHTWQAVIAAPAPAIKYFEPVLGYVVPASAASHLASATAAHATPGSVVEYIAPAPAPASSCVRHASASGVVAAISRLIGWISCHGCQADARSAGVYVSVFNVLKNSGKCHNSLLLCTSVPPVRLPTAVLGVRSR